MAQYANFNPPRWLTDGDNVAVWLFHRIIHFSTRGCVNSSEYLSPSTAAFIDFYLRKFSFDFENKKILVIRQLGEFEIPISGD